MADDMTAAERRRVKAEYKWILGLGLEDPTGSARKFYTDFNKWVKKTAPTPEEIAAYVERELPTIEAFQGLYSEQATAAINMAQAGEGQPLEGEVNRAIEEKRQSVAAIAEQDGTILTPEREAELAQQAYENGWGLQELRLNMRGDLRSTVLAGDTTGTSGDFQNKLLQWASRNGLSLSSETAAKYVMNMTLGSQTLDDVKADLRKTYLAGMYPAWSDRINNGFDPTEIFAPYQESIGNLLETTIGMDDPLMKSITQKVGSDGKPYAVPLYEAERMARADERWQRTNNAYATYAGVAQNLLRTFGFA